MGSSTFAKHPWNCSSYLPAIKKQVDGYTYMHVSVYFLFAPPPLPGGPRQIAFCLEYIANRKINLIICKVRDVKIKIKFTLFIFFPGITQRLSL